MLNLVVNGESFDEAKQEFVIIGGYNLVLEHSLVALSKWELLFEKPFLAPGEKTPEEMFAYIKCMAVDPHVPEEIFEALGPKHLEKIQEYINKKMTATWFNESGPQKRSGEVITAELIYYWMSAFNVPFESETWPLQKLFALIKIHSLKQQKPKKMSRSDRLAEQRRINERNRAALGSKG